MLTHIIIELINISGTVIATILMRWLLKLSSPDQDIRWLKNTALWKNCVRLKFYRGKEYIHQLRAKRVYSSSNC